MEARLIKIDRNGSKHYEGMVVCDRCQGRGWYATGVHNGQLVPARPDNAVCYKCNGVGKVHGKWIERTPEYQAKLDARRKAKRDAEQAELDRQRAEIEEQKRREKLAEEERERARKAISQYVGQIGDKFEGIICYERCGSWEQPSYAGWGTVTMYCHTFKDVDGNKFVWKTERGLGLAYGQPVMVKGTIKDHKEYDGEKQTVLTRCRIKDYREA